MLIKNCLTVPAKTKTITATLKDTNNVIKNKKITFTIKGNVYAAKTNSKGVATVKISLKTKGTYNLKVKYFGDKTYKAVNKTPKIKII